MFADLADEGHVVVVDPTETRSIGIDLVDVPWRTDLRSAVAVTLDPHLRRVVEDHTILRDAVSSAPL
ncbi:hypothetical protein [Streptomyces sp. NPDC096311]|uniref:hypothetical protein n=1 Tax=Streptomyces sp. NPDC096311 TaxID=3366083 RepID=UPI0037F4F9C9